MVDNNSKYGRINSRHKAQVALEAAIAISCVLILLLGALKIFLWINQRVVQRQEDYEATRISAGSVDPYTYKEDGGVSKEPNLAVREEIDTLMDESKYPKLDIFGTGEK